MSTQSQPVPGAPDINQTGLTFAQQQTLAASIANVAMLNAGNQAHYDAAIRDFNSNMETGQHHDPPLTPPVAPLKWQLAPADANGFIFYQQGPDSLTSTVTADTTDLGTLKPAVKNPNIIQVGNRLPGPGNSSWFGVGPNDGTPGGFETPPTTQSADGVVGTFEKFQSPWGSVYLKVS